MAMYKGNMKNMKRSTKVVAVSIAHVCAWVLLCMAVWHSGVVHMVGRAVWHAHVVQEGMYKASYKAGLGE